MKKEKSELLVSIEKLNKSLIDIQIELCKICNKIKSKEQTVVYIVEPFISSEDYD